MKLSNITYKMATLFAVLCFGVVTASATVLTTTEYTDPCFHPGEDSYNELVTAVKEGNEAKVLRLVVDQHVDPLRLDYKGHSLIVHAAMEGHLNIVRILHDEMINPDENMHQKDVFGDTALTAAARYGHLNIVMYLVSQQKSVRAQTKVDPEIQEALYNAIDGASSAALLEPDHYSPETVEHAKDREQRCVAVARYLIDSGFASVNQGDKETGNIPLMAAAHSGSLEMVKLLVGNENGFVVGTKVRAPSVNERNSKGQTALMFSADRDHLDITKYLLGNNLDGQDTRDWNTADPFIRDVKERTALDIAQASYSFDVANYLREVMHHNKEVRTEQAIQLLQEGLSNQKHVPAN